MMLTFDKFYYVRKNFGHLKWYTDRNIFGDGGGGGGEKSSKLIFRKNFFGTGRAQSEKSGKFVSAPLIVSFRYAHADILYAKECKPKNARWEKFGEAKTVISLT